MRRIKLALATAILLGASLLSSSPGEAALTCPEGCEICETGVPGRYFCCRWGSSGVERCS